MEFTKIKKELADNFYRLSESATHLFQVDLDKDELWNTYLDSFPDGTNDIFKERREYDCSACRQFIKNIGNVVFINEDNTMTSIWSYKSQYEDFNVVLSALNRFVMNYGVENIYFSKFNAIGQNHNWEIVEGKDPIKWEHFFVQLPDKFVDLSHKSLGDIFGRYRDVKNVFKRSLDELTRDSVETVLELISQNSLYKGEEWKSQLKEFLKLKKEYAKLESEREKDLYSWRVSVKVGAVIGKIRNHSIGTLLINISDGMDLDIAVKKYEDIVAPINYKRPKAIFTKKMLEQAQKTITDLGYLDSLGRRFAVEDDITINNVLFANRDIVTKKQSDVFSEMAESIAVNPKSFSKCEEITIDKFVSDILPNAKDIELLLENRLSKNLVSLIAPKELDSKTMFKWDNNFGWSYEGNITDSSIKENVSKAGGKVDGVLRFSIQWNDGTTANKCDYDAHCIEPGGNRILFSNKVNRYTTGHLDVDIIDPQPSVPAVENITWSDKRKMELGCYKFLVNCFSARSGNEGFSAQIEFDGEVYDFYYNSALRDSEYVAVAEVYFDGNKFKLKELLPSSTSGKDLWGLKTQSFVPVSMIMFSPNYWNEQNGIGNKHYFFMLKGCQNENNPNGFYNEFLKSELNDHRKVFEALGSKMKVDDNGNQLSGVGFSSTQRNEVIVKVKGSFERTLKIKF